MTLELKDFRHVDFVVGLAAAIYAVVIASTPLPIAEHISPEAASAGALAAFARWIMNIRSRGGK